MSRKRIWSLKWQTKTKKNKLAIYRAWPWISNCWEWDPNSGLSGFKSSALTTRPRRLGANLRRDATSRLLFLNQSVLADFDPRKKKLPDLRLVAFQNIGLWLRANRLAANTTKIEFMVIASNYRLNQLLHDPQIKLDQQVIKRVTKRQRELIGVEALCQHRTTQELLPRRRHV